MIGFKNFISKLFILFFALVFSLPAFTKQENIDNYLMGMTVTRTFAGNYYVRLKLQNETEKKYKLKELGNNSYALILPQVKSLIEERDIYYETEHPDIKIVFSEKKDLTDRNNFYTKINFKTKNDTFIRVEAYANKAVKTQVVLKKTPQELEQSKDNTVPNWIWYVSIGILSSICVILMAKSDNSDDSPEKRLSGRPDFKSDKNILKSFTTSDKLFPWHKKLNNISENEDEKESMKDYIEKKSQDNENTDTNNETDKIIDELVKIVIPQNDLVLMPGVPELPGLEKSSSISKNTKIVLNNVKIDLFDAKNPDEQPQAPIIPEKMTLAERLKNKDLIKEADEIIFEEKTTFFDNISPIKDIPETYEELESVEEKQEPQKEETDYDKLMSAFKKILTIAHKLKEDELDEEPDVIDTFAISDTVGFSLVKMGNLISLVGNIEAKVFLIKTFKPEELNDDTLFMEFCTQTQDSATYSVILNNFKALIKVTEDDISLIGEYD